MFILTKFILSVKQTKPEDQPQGFLNNDPRKNSPIFKNQSTNTRSGPKSSSSQTSGNGGSKNSSPKSNPGPGSASSRCQGGSLDQCIENCSSQGYAKCVSGCGQNC